MLLLTTIRLLEGSRVYFVALIPVQSAEVLEELRSCQGPSELCGVVKNWMTANA